MLIKSIIMWLTTLRTIFDWIEVWIVLVPLSGLFFFKPDIKKIQPVHIYFFIALILNTLIDVSWKYKSALPAWAHNNNVLYNMQSVTRVVLFTLFLSRYLSQKYQAVFRWVLAMYAGGILINFIFFESPFTFSSRLFSAESLFLLTLCILYFFSLLNDDRIFSYRKQPAFWIATSLSLYEASNFSIFLFYTILMNREIPFAVRIWDVHNIFYSILCIFSTKAFYECRRK